MASTALAPHTSGPAIAPIEVPDQHVAHPGDEEGEDGFETGHQLRSAQSVSIDKRKYDHGLSGVQDICLVIIGNSTHIEKLARRRLAAGGRLIVIEADLKTADMRKVDYRGHVPNEFPILCRPPPYEKTTLGNTLGDHPPHYWCKQGPCVVSLKEN